MATLVVTEAFGGGGANLAGVASGEPNLAAVLRGLADDIGDRAGITSPNATDLASALVLVNEIKAALNSTRRVESAT